MTKRECDNCGKETTNRPGTHSDAVLCDDCDNPIFVGPTP